MLIVFFVHNRFIINKIINIISKFKKKYFIWLILLFLNTKKTKVLTILKNI